MSQNGNLRFSHLSVSVRVARCPLKDPHNVAPATSHLGDTDLGLETQGYRKKCLQHNIVSKKP